MTAWVPFNDPEGEGFKFLGTPTSFEPELCVPERHLVPTGLKDAEGRELFWIPERIGFHNPLGEQPQDLTPWD